MMYYQTVEDTFQYLPKLPQGSLIEFGVFNGNTMNRLINGAVKANNEFIEVHGFDSFIGLPKETTGVEQNPDWPEGAFNVSKDYNLCSVNEAVDFVRERIDRKNIEFYPGYFSSSLTEELGKKLENSASYAHIDVDIYSSTWQVLDWLLEYKVLKHGAVVRYDDWISTTEYRGGNSLAHADAVRKHRVMFNRLSVNVFQYLG
jgi:hypothetical protein